MLEMVCQQLDGPFMIVDLCSDQESADHFFEPVIMLAHVQQRIRGCLANTVIGRFVVDDIDQHQQGPGVFRSPKLLGGVVALGQIAGVDEKIDAEVHHAVDFVLLPAPEGQGRHYQPPESDGRDPEDDDWDDGRGLLGQSFRRGCG